jgi:hypothetical protein
LFGAMVGGIVDHYFFNLDFPHSVSLFWLYAGLAVVAARMAVHSPEEMEELGETTL